MVFPPNSITHLTFGRYFNQDITTNGSLPNSITHLIFGRDFNQDITGVNCGQA